MIGLVDYGMGNVHSVRSALEANGAEVKVCDRPQELEGVERIVLPGVGAFSACMQNLKTRGFVEALNRLVCEKKVPILGICLGMQMMADRSFEGTETKGLGWIAGDVIRIDPGPERVRVPHVGWQTIRLNQHSLFDGVPDNSDFYFVHSYHMQCKNPETVAATCHHGKDLVAAIHRDNIFATQFHPEKSQAYGLKLLHNFMTWRAA